MQACNDWLRLGPGRTLRALLKGYIKRHRNAAPTRSLGTLLHWSARFAWQARAGEYDAKLDAEKTRRAQHIMASGLALAHERVVRLKRLAKQLEDYLHEADNVWLPDVKQIGAGELAERVDIVRFNAALIEQFRATLDDLASETGGRRQGIDARLVNIDLSRLTDDQLERVAGGEDPLIVLATAGQGGAGEASAQGPADPPA